MCQLDSPHLGNRAHPQHMLQMVIILLCTKGRRGLLRIALQNPIWKTTKLTMDSRLKYLELYTCLHGVTARRGCITTIMEAKLAQQLEFVEQAPLYEICINLRKAFDVMDRRICLRNLKDREADKNTRHLNSWYSTQTMHLLTNGIQFFCSMSWMLW